MLLLTVSPHKFPRVRTLPFAMSGVGSLELSTSPAAHSHGGTARRIHYGIGPRWSQKKVDTREVAAAGAVCSTGSVREVFQLMPRGDDCSRTLALLLLCGLPSLGQQTLPVWADSFSWEEGCGQVKSAGENDYS